MNRAAVDYLIAHFGRSTARIHQRTVERLEAYRAGKFGLRETTPAKKKGRANGRG